MFKHRLEQDLIELMPRARRYCRALVGSISGADSLLALAAGNVKKNAPPFGLLTPTKMVLPWLFMEVHKILDSDSIGVELQRPAQTDQVESILYAQFDKGLASLTDTQKRAYLLTTLEQFPMPITAHILGQSVDQIRDHFKQAHQLVTDHVLVPDQDDAPIIQSRAA